MGLRAILKTSRGMPCLAKESSSSGVKVLCTALVNSQVLPSIFFTLKSQITPTFILPVGVKMSESETSRK